ncbi:hypothetical protein BUALT_Bualt12G0015300 [Buddleja alternifolia]|uniref:Carbonic anhydrase n=1 Tax=Buddleja alternifolia TaxID=168488 RepID=A0AAV6WP51_9LAMI|nr:hypothetical protein BUALT_Bualt12G0015300 [Buddleja alternifolia]
MALKSNNFTLILFNCLLLSSLVVTVNANGLEVEDQSTFSYVWGAPDGPQNWGNLNPNWTLCETGIMQSPINIVDYRVTISPSLGGLITNYTAAPASIRNRGHDIQVRWTGDAGGIVINNDAYNLQQCHWHTPSEHTLNYERFRMELHLVHTNAQGNIAVIGILFRLGAPDPFLRYVSSLAHIYHYVDPSLIRVPGVQYYRYNGSLTTPPCSENVSWTVMRTVRTASWSQIRALRNAIHDGAAGNARPIQPRRRTVYLYQPTSLVSEM